MIESAQIRLFALQIKNWSLFIKMVINVSISVKVIMFINLKKMGKSILFVMIHVYFIMIVVQVYISHIVKIIINVMNLVVNIHINNILKADNVITDV